MNVYISPGNLRMDIPTFSIPAETTCPGATDHCKKFCYAKKAEKMYKNVRSSRHRNLEATRDPLFVSEMIAKISKLKSKYFRIHESGDFVDQEYFDKWCDIARGVPDKSFLANTKTFWLNFDNKPDNLVLYMSVWDDTDQNNIPPYFHKAYCFDNGKGKIGYYKLPNNIMICQKGHKIDKCNECMWCYNNKGDVAFELHLG